MITAAIWGTIAFPSPLSLSTLEGIPLATRPTEGSTGHGSADCIAQLEPPFSFLSQISWTSSLFPCLDMMILGLETLSLQQLLPDRPRLSSAGRLLHNLDRSVELSVSATFWHKFADLFPVSVRCLCELLLIWLLLDLFFLVPFAKHLGLATIHTLALLCGASTAQAGIINVLVLYPSLSKSNNTSSRPILTIPSTFSPMIQLGLASLITRNISGQR